MQRTKNGIPCNVPRGYKKTMKVKVVKPEKRAANIQHKHFAELRRVVDGLEQIAIGPVGTKEYNRAIKHGFEQVDAWVVN